MRPSPSLVLFSATLLVSLPRAAFGVESGAAAAPVAEEASRPSIVAPLWLSGPEPSLPPELVRPSAVVRVVLELTIETDGSVGEIRVQDGTGSELERAAEEAARAFRFSPAQRGGVPVRARVLHAIVFTPEPEDAEPRGAESEEGRGAEQEREVDEASFTSAVAPETRPSGAAIREVLVRGRSEGSRLERSAYAVTVVDTTAARRRAADLGEVLARETAVTVQRAGGLGSRGNYSLGGLGGERLRFFLNGVPLEYLGFAAGVGNVPVNLVDRVEIYQGVVPIRFGADALAGAVQLVSDEDVRTSRASASYQTGSFGTHRSSLSARYFHEPTGLFVRGSSYFDAAANDYPVDVRAYDAQGRTFDVTVPRFHDGYTGVGTNLAVGVVDTPWADRLVIQGFLSSFAKDVQNGVTMERPYGEVEFDRGSLGGNAKYTKRFGERARLEATLGYVRFDARFTDLSSCIYDWYGRCTPRFPENLRGEMFGAPLDQHLRTDTGFLRSELSVRLSDDHRLRIAVAPTYSDRSGKNYMRGPGFDPLTEPRRLFTGVLGAEYEASFFSGKLENVAFVKGYALSSQSRALLGTGEWLDMSRDVLQGGGGDSLRYLLTDELYLKASYEYATRLPTTDELFGDGMLVSENLGLRPETSHNVNLGVFLDGWQTELGALRLSANGFFRGADELIALLAEGEFLRNVNVYRVRALGLESALGWTAPGGDWLSLDGRLTYQDLRNDSQEGEFSAFAGDRLPSIPHLQATASALLRGRGFIVPADVLELSWNLRYVPSFLRGWESAAVNAERLTIPEQLTQGIALTYAVRGGEYGLASTLEAQNLTDERVFDFYGVQRPGRAFFAKWTIDY